MHCKIIMKETRGKSIALFVGPLQEKEQLVLLDCYLILRICRWVVVVGRLEDCKIRVLLYRHRMPLNA